MDGKVKIKDKTVFRAIGLMGIYVGCTEGEVDVKDGKVVRVRPFHYDYNVPKEEVKNWTLKKDGKSYRPPIKSFPTAYNLGYKKRLYSPNRILYPLKRVDWDPNGERNTQNRGKSKYKRISWEEASALVASEIKRVHKKYGPYAIMSQAEGHGETKIMNTGHGHLGNLLDRLGGFTTQVRNPDSWEGWYWGAKHVWGGNIGLMSPPDNVLKDVTDHAELVLFWGCDPESTPGGLAGQFVSGICHFWRDIGIKQVYICPDVNYGCAVHADKWIPIYPNTDAALQLAIAYMWITEGTYNKEYVETHVVGFDKFSAYVLGEDDDGVAKTPEWASEKCGIPEWTIKALAREFARKTTAISHYLGGGLIRSSFSSEPARLEVCLLSMQGLGGPGVHQVVWHEPVTPRYEASWETLYDKSLTVESAETDGAPQGVPRNWIGDPSLPERFSIPIMMTLSPWQPQVLPKTLFMKAIKADGPVSDGPLVFHGSGAIATPTKEQFVKRTFPLPKEEGGAGIHMMWMDSPCRVTCWNCGHKAAETFRDPKLECIVVQHPWMENDTVFADIILPANTFFEVEDIITNYNPTLNIPNLMYEEQAVQPVGESKSDFEIVLEIAKHFGLDEEIKEGIDIAKTYELVKPKNLAMPWEEFKKKGYVLFSVADDWEKDIPGLRRFYEDPDNNPLPTPTGKLEFYSESLAKNFPDDKERPPIPKWIEKSEMHEQRRTSDKARIYPLLLMSNHPRWRVHAQCDDISWVREIPTCKITGPDGYKYEPVWINTEDAKKRGIKNGDIVKVKNEIGIVLAGAYVSERIMSGAVGIDHGARADFIKPGAIDRGGAINAISPDATISKNCVGMAPCSYLVDVERLDMEEFAQWRREYPEAFEREYQPDSGLQFSAWIEKEK